MFSTNFFFWIKNILVEARAKNSAVALTAAEVARTASLEVHYAEKRRAIALAELDESVDDATKAAVAK